MLYPGSRGPSLVSEEFNQRCIDFHVEATVQALPNPGNPMHSMRVITFRSFSDDTTVVCQQNQKKTKHCLPAKGTLQIMLGPKEDLPTFERVE